jgi:uncharacterized membrane protein
LLDVLGCCFLGCCSWLLFLVVVVGVALAVALEESITQPTQNQKYDTQKYINPKRAIYTDSNNSKK